MGEVVGLHDFYLVCPNCDNESWLIEYTSWALGDVVGITCSACFYFIENKGGE
jgi:hypothetical protein